jgi:hypothetical protein
VRRVLVCVCLFAVGCRAPADPDVAEREAWAKQYAETHDAASIYALASTREVLFSDGFYAIELDRNTGMVFRWTERHANARVLARSRNATLRIAGLSNGAVPVDVTVRVEGQAVDRFHSDGKFEREIAIAVPSDRPIPGDVHIAFDASRDFVPPDSPRRLAIAFTKLQWDEAP